LPEFGQEDLSSIGNDTLRYSLLVIVMSKEGLDPILYRVILTAGDKRHHLGKFIGHRYNGIIGLSVLRGVRKFDDKIYHNGFEW